MSLHMYVKLHTVTNVVSVAPSRLYQVVDQIDGLELIVFANWLD